jgi:DNA (cytosine-5)-methyltransferase 1
MLTFGELFAGIGGFSLGLERAGMKCKWQVEIEPYARAVLKKHWPEVPKHDDVRTFPPQGDYSVDLICGGFPCQDISLAGKGAGLAGERSGLWYEFARIIGDIRPRYVVVENVAALATRGLDAVLGTLSTLGYDAEWHVIPASAVGAPHRRERVWIVAYARCAHGKRRPDIKEQADGEACEWHQTTDHIERRCEMADVADAECERFRGGGHSQATGSSGAMQSQGHEWKRAWPDFESSGEGCNVAHSNCVPGPQQLSDEQRLGWSQDAGGSCGIATRSRGNGWWATEPDVGRVAHGIPSRVDRLRCLGNAVVPQVVEVIGRAIVEHEKNRTASGMRP